MDILKLLDARLHAISKGDHTAGLDAVRTHIESAMRHLSRGQKEADESSFADAIYRCNQAFEGSVKEAYRVLTGSNPERKTPDQIEKFLAEEKLLRKRVLAQLKNYRQDWRNPSTHDYKLDFDADEALLAIVSVSAFAIVLCDQISEKLAFDATQLAATHKLPHASLEDALPLVEQVAAKVCAFANSDRSSVEAGLPYHAVEAELGGYLAATLPKAKVSMHQAIDTDRSFEADIIVVDNDETVALEIKIVPNPSGFENRFRLNWKNQAMSLLHAPGISGVVLVILGRDGDEHGIREIMRFGDKQLKMVAPLSRPPTIGVVQ